MKVQCDGGGGDVSICVSGVRGDGDLCVVMVMGVDLVVSYGDDAGVREIVCVDAWLKTMVMSRINSSGDDGSGGDESWWRW